MALPDYEIKRIIIDHRIENIEPAIRYLKIASNLADAIMLAKDWRSLELSGKKERTENSGF